jgi:hypothetical protein
MEAEELAHYLPDFLNMPNVEKVEIYPDKE